MKTSTKLILDSIAMLLSMAVQSGGYLFCLFLLGLLSLNPWLNLFILIILNAGLLIYAISPLSTKVHDFIEKKIYSIYRWFKYRPRVKNGVTVYYAEIV